MKIIFISTITILFLATMANAQTSVSGPVSGVWILTGSPYNVIGDIEIQNGQSLIIEPGVEVNFQGHYKFTVNGNLQAVGTETDTISFTTDDQVTGWGGIRIDSYEICNLSFCRIEYGKTAGNYPDNHGGGLALLSSDAIISNCVFADNDATGNNDGMGGAVYAIGTGSSTETLTRFIDCKFIRNHAYGEGGAIKFTSDMNTEIIGCEFVENDCGYGGGAVSCYSVIDTKIINSLFADNYTMFSAGGAVNTLGFVNSLYFINCTLSGNSAVTGDGGAVNLAFVTAYFINSIIFDNPGMYSDDINLDLGGLAEIYYSDLTMPQGATGSNNIEEDPLFLDPANFDFRLAETSPCIDTAIALFVLNGDTLVNLNPNQYSGSAPDMGAFEYERPVGIEDYISIAKEFVLFQNYPNPFNPSTRIKYSVPQSEIVQIKVYDILGKEIKTLLNENRDGGIYEIEFNASNLPSGVYFYQLSAGNYVEIKKMVIIK